MQCKLNFVAVVVNSKEFPSIFCESAINRTELLRACKVRDFYSAGPGRGGRGGRGGGGGGGLAHAHLSK